MSGGELSKQNTVFRILLVEDNELNRQLLSDYLRHYGYDVFGLAEGKDLLPSIHQFQPHLILLDLKLPEIDGYMLLEQLQQEPTYAAIPVIVISALAFQADQSRALNLGARHYFVKPINLVELKETIHQELALKDPSRMGLEETLGEGQSVT